MSEVGEAIGQALPIAVGVAISPLPIVAVVLMLVTPRGTVNGPAFLFGWVLGLAIVGAVALLAAGGADASDAGDPAAWVSVLQAVLGAAAIGLAVKQLRGRHADAATPKWMQALDAFTPVRALAVGAALSAANPKNLLLALAGAATIAQTGAAAGGQAVAYAAFVLVASLGVGVPVVVALVMGDAARAPLIRLKGWLQENNPVIMGVLLLVIGAKLLGDAAGAL